MLAVTQFDMSAGACGAPPKPALAPTSIGVLINGLTPMVQGDYWNTHVRGDHAHPMFCAVGNPRVLCCRRPMVFTTAMLSCGDMAATGSPTVLIG